MESKSGTILFYFDLVPTPDTVLVTFNRLIGRGSLGFTAEEELFMID
jgi:hypothetical protein